jgi:peptidyl-prolyl cis-trans isomerase SurA
MAPVGLGEGGVMLHVHARSGVRSRRRVGVTAPFACRMAAVAGLVLGALVVAGRQATAQGGGASGAVTTPRGPDTAAAAAAAPNKSGTVTITTQAATNGTISADSVPGLSTATSDAGSTVPGAVPAKTRADSLRDSVALVERNRQLYPTLTTVPLDRIAAIVGDSPILWSDVLERVNVERAQGLDVPSDSVGQMMLARTVVNELINEELLVQKAKELKVEVGDEDVTPAADAQIKNVRSRFSSDAELRNALKQAGFGNTEEYRKTLIEQNKRGELQRKVIQKLKEDGRLIPVGVTEKDISQAFDSLSSKSKLPKRPATVTFRQIVIAPKPTPTDKAAARAKADSVLAELRRIGPSAENFAQMAKRESMDQVTKEQGGDLGWYRRGFMVPEFDRWMFALPPGQLSPVIETVFGYHIIRVDRRKPAEVDARHILIRWKIDSGDVLAAHQRADSLLAAWKAGANFDTLVIRYHDTNEEKGSLQPFPRDSLPASYSTAFAGKGANDYAGPFTIVDRGTGHPKFVIAQILTSDAGGSYTVSDWSDRIRAQLADERAIGRLLESLRKETYVQVRI